MLKKVQAPQMALGGPVPRRGIKGEVNLPLGSRRRWLWRGTQRLRNRQQGDRGGARGSDASASVVVVGGAGREGAIVVAIVAVAAAAAAAGG